jgi:hypothetical protein
MENSWLDEWIRYHLAVGVEHFVLYNDDEDTRVSDRILQPYVDQGLVENIHIRECSGTIRTTNQFCQDDCYRNLITNAVNKTRWLAIVDLDELILPRRWDDIRTALEEYEEYSGLAINWAIYGSSGYIKRPPTQINHLLHRSETNWQANRFVKSIIKPDRVLLNAPRYAHFIPTRDGSTVNENHEPIAGMRHAVSTEKIRINHYVVRSWQDFWEVKAQRPRRFYTPPCDEVYFERHDRNEVFDDEISHRFGHVVQD